MISKFIKIIKALGTILVVILALIQIWDWASSPSSDLNATISFGMFALPPIIGEQLIGIKKQISDIPYIESNPEIKGLISHLKSKESKELLDKIFQNIKEYNNAELQKFNFEASDLRGYWDIVVRNDGTKEVSSVTLSLPYFLESIPNVQYIAIKRRDSPAEEHVKSTGVIKLGQLQPREEIHIIAWTRIPPSEYDSSKITLTHANGIGNVKVLAPTGPLGHFIDKNWGLILLLLISLISFGIPFLLEQTKNRKTQKPDTT